MAEIDWRAVHEEATRHLQQLLRIDTTNPPGNEQAAAEYLAEVLAGEGFEPVVLAAQPGRGNVIARLQGRDERGPLLLQGHTDVVPADPSEWTRPPFSGDSADGCIWGRGALDMKGTVVMQLMAIVLARRLGLRPSGDIIFAAVADEEAGGFQGAGWLVDTHPELVRAEVALGEVGGFSLYVGDAVYYPIQVTEKEMCGLTITARGPSGHGSQPIRDGAMARAGRILESLTRRRLPLRVTPVAERFIRALAAAQPELLGLLDPERNGAVLAEMGAQARMFEAMTHDTAVPTIVTGGTKTNVIPGTVEISVDGRIVPGQQPQAFIEDVQQLIGEDGVVQANRSWAGGTPAYEAPMGLFYDRLSAIVQELAPQARTAPYLLTGGTDARHFARLGTDCYGFAPVRLPRDMPFWSLFHSADERIPIDGLRFGLEAVYRVVELY